MCGVPHRRNHGRDGLFIAVIVSVYAMTQSIQNVTSAYMMSSRIFTKTSMYLSNILIKYFSQLFMHLPRVAVLYYRVVTGVALKKYLGVFHFLITEQELGVYGTINTSFPAWAAWNRNENFYINDPQIRDGIDYHTLNWQNRSVNLDTVEVPLGKVVTGVRFRVIDGALTLQVRATEFDFITGRLQNLENSFWYASNAKNRVPIVLEEPGIPTNTEIKSLPDLRNNQYIQFQPSDVHKDIAQTTVPFVDAQLVQPAPNLVPLGGIGLYYKGFPKNGGFIAPKVLTYNYAPHIVAPIDN